MATSFNSIVDEVKERNHIEDVIEADGYPLAHRGLYWKCTTPNTGGLVVNVNRQLYYWNTRDQHGDVISWVMVQQKTDFQRALAWLCQRAGMPEPVLKEEDVAIRAAARAKEEALEVAARVFARWLLKSDEAMAYVQRRGWTTQTGEAEGEEPGTIYTARLGYSGAGTNAEAQEMRGEFAMCSVDPESPAAVAILGKQGNVATWAHAHEIKLFDDWVLSDRIPGMIGHKRLVYPHVRGGRVRYLSGRSIEGKMHYNLPEALVGEKQPYLNQLYGPKANQVIVVEGQADAVSLGQMGFVAMALAGVHPSAELAEMVSGHATVFVGLDADQAGSKNAWKVADALGPMTRLVTWSTPLHRTFTDGEESKPVKDANDLLRAMLQAGETIEGQAAIIQGLLTDTSSYVQQICAWAGVMEGAARDDAVLKALGVVKRLEPMQMSMYRKELAKSLGVDQRELANMLKTLDVVAEKQKQDMEPIYTWGGPIDGWLVEYLYDIDKDWAALTWRDPQGHIASGESVTIEGRLYKPYPVPDILRTGAIIFPSALGEHKTTRELVAYLVMYLNSVYLMPSEQMTRLIAYWILLTWDYDAFETTIYLRAMGGAGSGKTELMQRIGMVCYRTMSASGAASTSALFRAVERYKGTVMLDEADIEQSDAANDMVKFYNEGAMRGHPVWRSIEVTGPNGEKTWELASFQTFCPKLIAMRKEFRDDAIGSRSLTLKLIPRESIELKTAGITLSMTRAMREKAQILRNMLIRWRLETWQPEIEVDMESYDMTISARLNQVSGPLLMIARDDPQQQDDIRQTLRDYYAETIITQSMAPAARVIEAMWKIWNYPDLHKEMVKVEADGKSMMKVGNITYIANQLTDEMNGEDGDEDDDEKTKFRSEKKMKSRGVGIILRNELLLQVSTRKRDGFWVYWNEPRMLGISMKYGITPEDFGPDKTTAVPAQEKML